MAFLCSRLISRNLRSSFITANRFYVKEKELPDPMELATGLEKRELLALQSGDEDPFRVKAINRKPSTKNNPNIVESAHDGRIIGCICEEDSDHVVWMWVFKGEPRRCKCGHWFKLAQIKPV